MPKTSKFCLVTGASSGLGKQIALGLANAGHHVVMVCRNVGKGESAQRDIIAASGSRNVDLLIADLSSQQQIRHLASEIKAKYSYIDVLINNAALVSRERLLSADNIEMTLATNFLSPFLLTNLLLEVLGKSPDARIINISSAIHHWAKLDLQDLQYEKRRYQFMKAYAQSKLLLNIYSFELARRLEGSNITVNCVHPGAVKTNLGSDSANNIFLKYLDKIIKFFFISPEAAARTAIYLADADEAKYFTGKYFVKGKPVKASSQSYNPELATRVWEIANTLCAEKGTGFPARSRGE